jgi:hypothetical protein
MHAAAKGAYNVIHALSRVRAMNGRLCVALAFGLIAAACRGQAHPAGETPKQVVVWRAIGSWSGHGNRQTESFTSDTGALRIRWTANRGEPAGAFRLTAHSAISGRLLEQVIDHRGPGSGVGFVNQDPHVFYLMVESDRLDWTFSVEEGIAGTMTDERRR